MWLAGALSLILYMVASMTASVDGGWSDWSGWSHCSKSCNKGTKQRQRECINPQPLFGGLPCAGAAMQNQTCNFIDCPRESTAAAVRHNSRTAHSYFACCHEFDIQLLYMRRNTHNEALFLRQRLSAHVCDFTEHSQTTVAEEKPTEAPGAVSIGTIGLAFCFLLMVLVIVMDISTFRSNLRYMSDSVTSCCGASAARSQPKVREAVCGRM